MSSDSEDYADLNFGVNDDYAKSFDQKTNEDNEDENKKNLDFSSADKVVDLNEKNEEYNLPKFEKNPKLKQLNNKQNSEKKKKNIFDSSSDEDNENEATENPDCDLEDLMNLLEQEDAPSSNGKEEEDGDKERKKIFIRKEPMKSSKEQEQDQEETKIDTQPKCVSSITITKIPKEPENNNILTEKNTGIRLVKSTFKNDIDLNMRLACDFGKFLKLTDINRRAHELKESKDFKWHSVFLLMSKTESKCSANGNNYVIWKLTDVNNIDKQQDISLFLFGNAYKSHWKSNEFEVFALIQPDILDSKQPNSNQQPQTNNNSNTYCNSNSPSIFVNNGRKASSASTGSNWNKFAAKKVDLNNKLSLSVKSDHQLIRLGFAKDITVCQSFKSNSESNQIKGENSKQCKNLVNLQETPFCIYHCKQLDQKNKFGAGIVKNKYSMNEPKVNRLGSTSLFESTLTKSPDVAFMPNNDMLRNKLLMKAVEMDTKVKVSKEIKTEILNSLNASIKDSPLMAQIGAKTGKKSDLEILASLDGKPLDKEEIKKIRLAEQATTVRHYSNTDNSAQKEISKIFKSKILLPSEATCNNSISSKRLHEYKQSQTTALSTNKETGSVIQISPFDYSAKLKEKYNENKKNYNLSTMSSHKDILKKIKDKKDEQVEEVEATTVVASPRVNNKSIIAADFLAKRMNEIKNNAAAATKKEEKKPLQTNNTGFDLELYIGDSLTTKKLLDVDSKYISFSPSTATSSGYKRKLEELKKNDSPKSPAAIASTKSACQQETPEDKKAKKLKMIDEILSIKSNHLKEVNDPDKNPHLKNYFNKLELQESVDNKLCSVRNREIRAVTCKICSYTSFSQSDYCKKQNHVVNRHMAIQRYFKCKICNKRTYTIDKMCPISACSQCGNEKFEPCTMKEENISILKASNDNNLNQESEMLILASN